MNKYATIMSKNIDELARWISEYGIYDSSPWMDWWDKNYCSKCKPEMHYVSYLEKESECCWCEINHKCKYFQDMPDVPDCEEIIKMWLESEELE